jgi:ribose-phosphate pyrophosphokinase
MKRETALASLFADQLKVTGADVYLTYHPHTLSLYGFYEPEIKFVALSGLDLFVDMFKDRQGMDNVVAVSTDAGGAKFTVHYSDSMGISHAIASKFRKGKEKSNLLGIIGDLEDKKVAIITDDETVTGSSILNAVKSLYKNYGVKETYAAVSHLKVKAEYLDRFVECHNKFGLKEVHVTDTIPQIKELLKLKFIVMHHLEGMFAATINRMHYNQSISQVFSRG